MKNIPKKQFAGWMLMLLLCISISAFAQSPKKGLPPPSHSHR